MNSFSLNEFTIIITVIFDWIKLIQIFELIQTIKLIQMIKLIQIIIQIQPINLLTQIFKWWSLEYEKQLLFPQCDTDLLKARHSSSP